MKPRAFGHRVGNHSAASAHAYPNAKPLATAAQVPDGWFCSVCLCVLRERGVHAGCSATESDLSPHVKTLSPAEALLAAPLQWHCNKCGQDWAVRGSHPDCDAEWDVMVQIAPISQLPTPNS
jgi:hypothetical protein